MRVIINTLVMLDRHEQEIVKEALTPYRVLTEGDFTTHEDAESFPKVINRLSSPLREEWLLNLHRKVLDLKQALAFDADRWRRESKTAPEDGGKGSIIAKPKAVFTTLSETRERQVRACDCALEVLRNAMTVHKPVKEGAKTLALRAETLLSQEERI
jgi:hypothetical protein